MRRAFVLSLISSCAVALAMTMSSCSDETPAASAPDGGDEANAQRPPPKDPEPDLDAGPDATRPPVIVPSCVGDVRPLVVSGRRVYIDVVLPSDADGGADGGKTMGSWVVDYGTTGTTIDFGAWTENDASGPPPYPTSCAGDASAPGAYCLFSSFDFFGDWGQVELRTDTHSTLVGAKRQAGILGTDFLSVRAFTLDYTGQKMYSATASTFCTETQLLGAGFAPLPSDGFFTSDLSKLRPLSDVLVDPDGGTAGFTVPNVPTVPIAIGGVDALAQLDTGYEDRLVPYSININEALYAKIVAKDPTILDRDTAKDLFATTCVPLYSEPLRAYRLKAGATIDFIAEGGSVARTEPTAHIYVKERSDTTRPCGGISTWTVPAAQVGSSFYADAQVMIFDPVASRVWVPKKQ
jgi:hypothetical protein